MRRLLILDSLLVLALAQPLFACVCMKGAQGAKTTRENAEWQAKDSSVVFEGSVEQIGLRQVATMVPNGAMSLTGSGKQLVVKMRVMRAYRGPGAETLTVVTGVGGGDCGFEFEIGKAYVVHALETPQQELFTSICSATEPLDEAGPQLRVLRGQPPIEEDQLSPEEYAERMVKLHTGRICGRFARADGTQLEAPIVTIWRIGDNPLGPRKYDLAETKPDNSYCSAPLPAGKYIVGAEDGKPWDTGIEYGGYYRDAARASAASKVVLEAGKPLLGTDIQLYRRPVYTVQGRVVSDNGQPLPDNVRVAITSSEGELLFDPMDKGVERDGRFAFCCNPEGTYSMIAGVQQMDRKGRLPKWGIAKLEISVSKDTSDILIRLPSAPPLPDVLHKDPVGNHK